MFVGLRCYDEVLLFIVRLKNVLSFFRCVGLVMWIRVLMWWLRLWCIMLVLLMYIWGFLLFLKVKMCECLRYCLRMLCIVMFLLMLLRLVWRL